MNISDMERARRRMFWMLKKWSSYTVWQHYAKQFDIFVHAYEEAVASWPKGEAPPEYNLQFAYQAQAFYQRGLQELSQGNRTVWRARREDAYLSMAKGAAFDAMASITSEEINRYDGGERGVPKYTAWTPRLEQLRQLKELASPGGFPLVYERFPTYLDWKPIAFIDTDTFDINDYLQSSISLFGSTPFDGEPTPEPSTVVIESGENVPFTGVWELVNPSLPPGQTSTLNYFIKGAEAPWFEVINNDYSSGKQIVLPISWRLVWQDDRYLNGIIPNESEYLNQYESFTPLPNTVLFSANSDRIEANQACPSTGYWHSPAKQNSRAIFKQGEMMPDFPESSYGATIWYWDVNQE